MLNSISNQNLTYLMIFIFGVVFGVIFLFIWIWQKKKLSQNKEYYQTKNLNLWEYFKRNIAFMTSLFFVMIGLTGLFLWIT